MNRRGKAPAKPLGQRMTPTENPEERTAEPRQLPLAKGRVFLQDPEPLSHRLFHVPLPKEIQALNVAR